MAAVALLQHKKSLLKSTVKLTIELTANSAPSLLISDSGGFTHPTLTIQKQKS